MKASVPFRVKRGLRTRLSRGLEVVVSSMWLHIGGMVARIARENRRESLGMFVCLQVLFVCLAESLDPFCRSENWVRRMAQISRDTHPSKAACSMVKTPQPARNSPSISQPHLAPQGFFFFFFLGGGRV